MGPSIFFIGEQSQQSSNNHKGLPRRVLTQCITGGYRTLGFDNYLEPIPRVSHPILQQNQAPQQNPKNIFFTKADCKQIPRTCMDSLQPSIANKIVRT